MRLIPCPVLPRSACIRNCGLPREYLLRSWYDVSSAWGSNDSKNATSEKYRMNNYSAAKPGTRLEFRLGLSHDRTSFLGNAAAVLILSGTSSISKKQKSW